MHVNDNANSYIQDGQAATYGLLTDAVFGGSVLGGTASSLELTTGWGVNAAYEHFWNPRWRTSLYGGYAQINYDNVANANLCSAQGTNPVSPFGTQNGFGSGSVAFARAGCDNNWSPSSNFEQSVLAKRQTTAPSRISVRYYLWSAEGPRRITGRLHRDLVERDVALPQYAGTKQRVLEVFVQRLTKMDYSISARGVVYPFDSDGFLASGTYLPGILPNMGRFKSHQRNIVDLSPLIKRRRFRDEYTWKPSKSMLDEVWSDIEPRRSKKGPRLPVLRPLGSPRTVR